MFDKIYPQMWMELPHEIRLQLAKDFELVKSKGTEVIDRNVVSDGYTTADLAKITKAKMEEYVGSTAEFPRLWEITVAKAKSIVNPAVDFVDLVEEHTTAPETSTEEVVTNPKSRKNVKAKKSTSK